MSRQIGAELLKLRTTKTAVALIGSVLGIVVLISLLATLTGDMSSQDFNAVDLLGISGFSQLIALVLGILAVTTEFRHGTITPTLIAQPDRLRVMNAKLISHVLAGLVLATIAVGVCTAIVLAGLSARDIETGLESGEVTRIAIGQIVAGGLWAALGVGLGALIGNQVGAIVGALAYTLVVENLLTLVPSVGDQVQKYGINGASNGLGNLESSNTGDVLAQVPGGLVLAAYALAFVIAGTIMLRRRDVTS
jgi:ABC-2 type transport system permease protein